MGQTCGCSFYDEHGVRWTWVYVCPYCDAELATKHLVDCQMSLETDDIIGCSECHRDVSVDAANQILIDTDGNRA